MPPEPSSTVLFALWHCGGLAGIVVALLDHPLAMWWRLWTGTTLLAFETGSATHAA